MSLVQAESTSASSSASRRDFLKYAVAGVAAAGVAAVSGSAYYRYVYQPSLVKTVTIGYLAGTYTQAIYEVARDRNLGAKYNLNINWQPFTDLTIMTSSLIKGSTDVYASNMGQVAGARASGQPVIAFNCFLKPSNAIVAAIDTQVNSLSDLTGKTIGEFGLPSTTMALVAALQEKQGKSIDPSKDYKYARGPFGTLVGQLAGGQLQFAELVEPYITQLTITKKFKVIASANNLWKQYTGGFDLLINAWATTEDFAKKNPAVLTAILQTYADAVAYVKANPDSTVRSFLQKSSGINDDNVLNSLIPQLLDALTIVPWDDAALSRQQQLLNLFAKYGLVQSAPTNFLTNKFNP